MQLIIRLTETDMLLSLCMIVKNEETWVQPAIESLKGTVDEIIVVDTGSSDSTAKIAAECGAVVIPFKWNDNFSEARNFSISQAKSEWIIFIDADEIIAPSDAEKIPDMLKNKSLAGLNLIKRNYTNNDKIQGFTICSGEYKEYETAKGYVDNERALVFRNSPDIKFSGVIHESVAPAISRIGGVIAKSGIVVHHYGYLKGENNRQKADYYLKLGQKQIQLTPDDPKPYYDIAIIHLNNGDLINAEKFFLKTIQIDEKYQNVMYNLGMVYFKWNKFEPAIACFDKAAANGNHNADLFITKSIAFDYLGKPNEASNILKEAITLYPQNDNIMLATANLYLKQGNLKKSAEIFDALLIEHPLNPRYCIGVIQTKYLSGNLSGALEIAEFWDRNSGFDNQIAHITLYLYEKLSLWTNYEHKLEKYREYGLNQGEVYYFKAIFEEHNGNTQKSLYYYKQSLSKSPYMAQEIQNRLYANLQ